MANSKAIDAEMVDVEGLLSEEEVYEVEKLVDHRRSATNKNKVEYLVKWKDYGHDANTWEDEKNIISRALVSSYWHSQQYTLQEFKNRTHQSVDAVLREKKSASPKPSPQQVMLEMEKRRKLNEVREAQISAEPPAGLTWQDISAVKNVFYSGKSTYFAEIRWTRPDVVSYIPTRIIRRNNPLKLIQFYETYIDFKYTH